MMLTENIIQVDPVIIKITRFLGNIRSFSSIVLQKLFFLYYVADLIPPLSIYIHESRTYHPGVRK